MVTIHAPLPLPNGSTLKNRLAKSAMSERLAARDGAPNDGHTRLYRRWAQGGAALLITGNVMVDARAIGESGNVVVEDERHLPSLRAWVEAAHQGGAQLWMQINHPGRQSPRNLSPRPVAPSAVGMKGAGGAFAKPRALEDHEIEELVARFANTARIAREAGFDGVQIHAAHGYLINQFLSPLTNLRDDRWGGDAGRRRAFLVEIVRAVRKVVPQPFAVSVKLNSADFQRGGFSEEESLEVLRVLESEGVDLIEISGGTYEAAAMFREPKGSTAQREAFFLAYAEKARTATRVPLMVTGGFRTAEGMNSALGGGALDVVGLARPLAVEPDLPTHLLSGQAERATAITLDTGWKKLDAVVQAAWYQAQINRLGSGLPPKPTLCRLGATLRFLRGPSRRRLAA
jgi:2,4-dienoyl-CoA reductase-like NADH-dependent reductase (Old Yellow Enzyme family)